MALALVRLTQTQIEHVWARTAVIDGRLGVEEIWHLLEAEVVERL